MDFSSLFKKKSMRASAFGIALLLLLAVLSLLYPQIAGSPGETGTAPAGSPLQVFFLDVGQADSTLALLPNGEVLLIDAGNRADGKEIAAFIESRGITAIDYFIATHPHEDHIGGMTDIIDNFDVKSIYMPKLPDEQVPTTKTYLNLLNTIDEKGLRIKTGAQGVTLVDTVIDSGHLSVSLLAPVGLSQKDLNNYSVVTQINYTGSRSSRTQSVLIMGDAGKEVEQAMLDEGVPVSADVIRIGHHGSQTGSSANFIAAVKPLYAVISCGRNNDYGHPHEETLDVLSAQNVNVWRTDLSGTIIAKLDGETVNVTNSSLSCNGDPPKLTWSEVLRIFHGIPVG